MYMPMMINIQKAVVFAGERGEGLQKTEKLSIYADKLLVVPEQDCAYKEIVFPAGPIVHGTEELSFAQPVRVPVNGQKASKYNYKRLIRGADFVCSDLSDRKLNEKISRYCKKKNIRCNVIDTKDLCDTWFMSLIDVPGMLVGISSKGGCAYYSKETRQELQEQIRARGQMSLVLLELKDYIKYTNTKIIDKSKKLVMIPSLSAIYTDPQFRELMAQELKDKAIERAKILIDNRIGVRLWQAPTKIYLV